MLAINRTFRQAATALLLLMACFFHASGDASASCLSPAVKADISACEQELKSNPHDTRVRLALTNALIELGRHKEAVSVLKAGLEIDPENQQMKTILGLEEGFLEEQSWAEKQRAKRALGRTGKIDYKTKRNKIRCAKFKGESALDACNEGLEILPNDIDLLIGKGKALLSLNQVSEAILVLRKARALQPSNLKLTKILQRAESKRNAISGQCFRLKGAEALKACNTALLKGAPDEFRIQQRRGDLLSTGKPPKEARKAYEEARRLKPSTIDIDRKSAVLEGVKKPTPAKKATPRSVVPQKPALISETGLASRTALKTSQDKISGKELTALPPVSAAGIVYSNAPIKPGVTH